MFSPNHFSCCCLMYIWITISTTTLFFLSSTSISYFILFFKFVSCPFMGDFTLDYGLIEISTPFKLELEALAISFNKCRYRM